MVRLLFQRGTDLRICRTGGGGRAAASALIASVVFLAGCGEKPRPQSPAMADAEATLARERTIRDGMSLERKKLDGEKQVHLLRAMIIAGDLKPPVVAADSRSPIVRACPSWGIRRVWRLWGRRPREMPWYDEGVGSRMQTTTNEVYKLRDADLERRILVQDRRIEEATKYLELVKKLGDGA